MSRPAGIKAVAERALVSVGTVSNVLNRPDQVAAPTRARVEAAMRELGFVRNSSAGSLRAGRSHALGLVVLDIGNPFFTDVARGVEQAAAEQGYAVLLCNSDGSPARQATHLRFLEEHRVDGVLLTPADSDLDRVRELEARGTSVVLVDEAAQPDRCSAAVDDIRGGQLVGEHLLSRGRERVAYVTGPDSIRQCADRGRGLEDTGLHVRRVEIDALTGAAGYAAARRVTRTDAVFCANDVVALGVLRALLEQGVRVPDDVALVGYDDIEFAATAAVPLTSIRQPALQLGRTAALMLLDEISAPAEHAHQQVLFTPELVTRRSTGG
ncbi:MAG: LacI family transcriptional regulator [Frankiales bacterium]|jgi:LacI family transcriptional regulator|nr:LacI family transcriptional regulator [Frankiales bacterium]